MSDHVLIFLEKDKRYFIVDETRQHPEDVEHRLRKPFNLSGLQSSLLCHNLRQERRPASIDQPAVRERRVFQRGGLCEVLRRGAGGRRRILARAWRHPQRSQARKYSPE